MERLIKHPTAHSAQAKESTKRGKRWAANFRDALLSSGVIERAVVGCLSEPLPEGPEGDLHELVKAALPGQEAQALEVTHAAQRLGTALNKLSADAKLRGTAEESIRGAMAAVKAMFKGTWVPGDEATEKEVQKHWRAAESSPSAWERLVDLHSQLMKSSDIPVATSELRTSISSLQSDVDARYQGCAYRTIQSKERCFVRQDMRALRRETTEEKAKAEERQAEEERLRQAVEASEAEEKTAQERVDNLKAQLTREESAVKVARAKREEAEQSLRRFRQEEHGSGEDAHRKAVSIQKAATEQLEKVIASAQHQLGEPSVTPLSLMQCIEGHLAAKRSELSPVVERAVDLASQRKHMHSVTPSSSTVRHRHERFSRDANQVLLYPIWWQAVRVSGGELNSLLAVAKDITESALSVQAARDEHSERLASLGGSEGRLRHIDMLLSAFHRIKTVLESQQDAVKCANLLSSTVSLLSPEARHGS